MKAISGKPTLFDRLKNIVGKVKYRHNPLRNLLKKIFTIDKHCRNQWTKAF